MILKGKCVSDGIAIGDAYLYHQYVPNITEKLIDPNTVKNELLRLENAKERAKCELLSIVNKLSGDKDKKSEIFKAHLDILCDTVMDEDIQSLIEYEHYSAEAAVDSVCSKFASMIEKAKDELLRERAADIHDIKIRLLRNLSGIPERNLNDLPKPVVIFADNLFPSDTATMDRKNVLAIVTEKGGETSHTAIIAKSYGIPAVLGVKDMMAYVKEGNKVIVDALNGDVYIDPDDGQMSFFTEQYDKYLQTKQMIGSFISKEPFTQDNKRIEVHLNIGSGNPNELEGSEYVDGIGLFRTEFLYMERDKAPTEDEQYEVYRNILSHFGNRPVTLRTLDIGGDKTVCYLNLPKEDNPFLGNRALRFCFSHPEIFKTQLRAAFRASVFGNLQIMLPMVGSLDDIQRAKTIINEVKEDLKSSGIPYREDVKIGIMIEIPSIALMADIVANEVDFASIGTNDLCQYTLAVDRMNSDVCRYYQNFHPAIFRLIGFVADKFIKQNKVISVCGEMGGDPLAATVLIGLGITKLSMGLSSVPRVKKIIADLTMPKARLISDTVCKLATADEIKEYLKAELK